MRAGSTIVALWVCGCSNPFLNPLPDVLPPEALDNCTSFDATVVNLQLTQTATGVSLNWDVMGSDAAEVTAYRVMRRLEGEAELTARPAVFGMTSLDEVLGEDQEVFYEVSALRGNCPAAQGSGVLSVLTRPGPVENLRLLNATGDGIQLGWDNNNTYITGHRVERAPQMGTTFVDVSGLTTSTTFFDMGLMPMTGYQYNVYAINADGETPTAMPITEFTSGALDAFSAATAGTTAIDLTWSNSVMTINNFHLQRQIAGAMGFTDVDTMIPGGTMVYSDTGLVPDSQYNYLIRATGPMVAELSSSTSAWTQPLMVTGLQETVANKRADAVSIEWMVPAANTGSTGIVVQRYDGAGMTMQDEQVLGAGDTMLTASGLTAGTDYEFRVFARNPGPDGSAATVLVTTNDNPSLMLGAGSVDADCNLTVPGIVTPDGSAVATTFSGTIDDLMAAAVMASQSGLTGQLTNTTPHSFSVSWTVDDNLGGSATAMAMMDLAATGSPFYIARPLPNSATPTAAGVPGEGRQSFAAGSCTTNCAGERATVSVHRYHACTAVDGDGWCWGLANLGRLGIGPGSSVMPVPQPVCEPCTTACGACTCNGQLTGVRSFSAGPNHTCAVLADGTAVCFGQGNMGQLGRFSMSACDPYPTYVGCGMAPMSHCTSGRLSGIVEIVTGQEHSCALLDSGDVYCFGSNMDAQLAQPAGGMDADPRLVPLPTRAVALASSSMHTCAVLADQTVRCWGQGQNGRLGNDILTPQGWDMPQTVTCTHNDYNCTMGQPLANVVAIAAGGAFTCALIQNGEIMCWGSCLAGQCANADHNMSSIGNPQPVCDGGGGSNCATTPAHGSVVALTAGFEHVCALHEDGTAACWGDGMMGQLGNDTIGQSTFPSAVCTANADCTPLPGVVAISAGSINTCAVLGSGEVRCWGAGGDGVNGDDSMNLAVAPVAVLESSLPAAPNLDTGTPSNCEPLEIQ